MATLTRIHSHLSRTKASRFSPLLGWLLLLGVATVLSGCTHTPLYHRLIMKGQVVSVDSETIATRQRELCDKNGRKRRRHNESGYSTTIVV